MKLVRRNGHYIEHWDGRTQAHCIKCGAAWSNGRHHDATTAYVYTEKSCKFSWKWALATADEVIKEAREAKARMMVLKKAEKMGKSPNN